jgi:hypothetical protein
MSEVISTTDAQALYTKKIIAVYKERNKVPTSFLRSFFKVVESDTKEVSILVERGTEKIAVDVARGTKGHRNAFSLKTEKVFVPPYFREYFDATEMDIYDRLFTSDSIDESVMAEFVKGVVDKLRALQAKIERTYELYCAMVFQTGVVELQNDTNINFLRKAASMVDLNATTGYWSVSGHDLYVDLETGCDFIKTEGKAEGSVFVAILGRKAHSTMMKNSVFLAKQNMVSMKLDQINTPQSNSVGGKYHGRLTCGPYEVDIWTYPEKYQDKTLNWHNYIDETNVIILPPDPNFVFAFGAVPRLFKGKIGKQPGQFVFGEYLDEEEVTHKFDVKSAGVPVPVAIDCIYTMKAVA